MGGESTLSVAENEDKVCKLAQNYEQRLEARRDVVRYAKKPIILLAVVIALLPPCSL